VSLKNHRSGNLVGRRVFGIPVDLKKLTHWKATLIRRVAVKPFSVLLDLLAEIEDPRRAEGRAARAGALMSAMGSPQSDFFRQCRPAFLRAFGKSRWSLDRILLDNIALRVPDGAADRRNLVGMDRRSPIPSPLRGRGSFDNAKRVPLGFWAAKQIRKAAHRVGGHADEALLSIAQVYIRNCGAGGDDVRNR